MPRLKATSWPGAGGQSATRPGLARADLSRFLTQTRWTAPAQAYASDSRWDRDLRIRILTHLPDWPIGQGAVAIFNLMEDAAMAEIFR